MKHTKSALRVISLITITILYAVSCSQEPIRIACVGDSITYGHGIRDREHDAYPGVLDSLLGKHYTVKNFGISGRTLMNSGDSPYMNEQIYQDALNFQPHIVTIKLGTNDSKPYNWVHKDDFKADLKQLVNSFKELDSRPEVILCLPAPAMGRAWNINDSVITNGVIPYIKEVAQEENLKVIDLNTPLRSHREYFPDTIHPNEEGSLQIATIISNFILSLRK